MVLKATWSRVFYSEDSGKPAEALEGEVDENSTLEKAVSGGVSHDCRRKDEGRRPAVTGILE